MTPLRKGDSMAMWGAVTRVAPIRETNNGKKVHNFSIVYGIGADEEGGEKKKLYMDCTAWGKIANYTSLLEPGDVVLVCGQLAKNTKRSEYTGRDCWYIDCEYVHAMEIPAE